MTRGRHSLAPRASKPRRFALLAAPLITTGVVGVGLVTTNVGQTLADDEVDFSQYSFDAGAAAAPAADRTDSLSRSEARVASAGLQNLVRGPVPEVERQLWTTADLDLRLMPRENAKVAGEFDAIRRIGVTGVRRNGFAQVVVNRQVRWVSAEYLAAKKPDTPATMPLFDKPCAGTSGVEAGLTSAAVRVYRAVCNNFPQITSYGGRDGHGEHSTGRAIDIMTNDESVGNAIADFLRIHAAELNLYDVIYRQRIFTQERAGEGWRPMGDRGSATANHMDHVHVSVY